MTIRDKILVVEDEKTISGLIKAILTANGYDVILASTGSEAFSMISSHCPDLVVLDLGLPDMDGMEIIETVRQWTQIPIVVVSARSYERDKVQALEKGADDYITKPFGAAGPDQGGHPPHPHRPCQQRHCQHRQIYRRGPDHRL